MLKFFVKYIQTAVFRIVKDFLPATCKVNDCGVTLFGAVSF